MLSSAAALLDGLFEQPASEATPSVYYASFLRSLRPRRTAVLIVLLGVTERVPQLRSPLETILNVALGYASGFLSPAVLLADFLSSLRREFTMTPCPKVPIDTNRIVDWNSFHDVFAEAFGFPDFYGRNMNAWVDCLSSLDDPEDRMTTVHTPKGVVVVFELSDATDLSQRRPEIYQTIIENVAFVNFRKLEAGEAAVLTLSFWRHHR